MTLGLRPGLVAALIVALTLAGLGRALSTASEPASALDAIVGAHVLLFHSGAAPADPVRPASHDSRSPLAAAVLSTPSALSVPACVAHFAHHAQALAWAPARAPRARRSSRCPPAA